MDKKRNIIWYVLGVLVILALLIIGYFFMNKEEIVEIKDIGIGGAYNYNSCLSEPYCSAVLININFSLLKEDKNNCLIFKNGQLPESYTCPPIINSSDTNGYSLDCDRYMSSYTDWRKWQVSISRDELVNYPKKVPFFEICCRSEKIRYSEQSTLDKSSFECSKPYYLKNLKDLVDNNYPYCIDSDGGIDYFSKGTLTGRWGEGSEYSSDLVDSCNVLSGPNILVERYCIDNYPKVEIYDCPNGCLDGACID